MGAATGWPSHTKRISERCDSILPSISDWRLSGSLVGSTLGLVGGGRSILAFSLMVYYVETRRDSKLLFFRLAEDQATQLIHAL